MSLDIHQDIYTQLNTFFDENRVPNIIFHGRNRSGKKTIVKNYINKIYKTKEEQKKYVLIVDCIQYNGIKFIREDLKFFSRSPLLIKSNCVQPPLVNFIMSFRGSSSFLSTSIFFIKIL